MGENKKNGWGQMGMDLAGQIGQGVIGTGLGLLLENHEDKRQREQQEKLMRIQMQGSKEMTDYNTEAQRKKEMQMWLDTNYSAQMEQMKKAGINPGLMYGEGGGGGTTTGGSGMAGAVSGAMAPSGKGTAAEMALETAQLGLLRAQKENIEANTKKTESEVPVNTETTEGLRLDNLFKDSTMGKRIQEVTVDVRKKIEDLEIAETNNYINKETAIDQISKIATEAIGAALINIGQDEKNELTKEERNKVIEDTKKVKQDVENSLEQLKQGWKGLKIQEGAQAIQRFLAEYQANHPEMGKVMGGVIQRIAAAFGKPTNEVKVGGK